MSQQKFSIYSRTGVFLLSLWLGSLPAQAAPEVLGWLEGVSLQPWGVRVRGKLDSGALTSSIHARNIEKFEREGKDWVRFEFPFGQREGYPDGIVIERPLLRQAKIKEHAGDSAIRYVVELDICLSGDTYPIEVTLADRSRFNYPIILGRRAMAERYLVDSGASFIGDKSCPRRDAETGLVKPPKL